MSGIVSNEWYRPQQRALRSAAWDPRHPLLQVQRTLGTMPGGGVSPRALRVESVGDVLRRAGGGRSWVISVGAKDRAAVMLGGQRPDLALFFDPSQRAMTTSTYYQPGGLPGWVVQLAQDHAIGPRLLWSWLPLGGEVPTGQPAPGLAFAHQPTDSESSARHLHETPLGDEAVAEAALAAVDGVPLGDGDQPDLLLLSFSSHDGVCHRWGQESEECVDTLRRVDRLLGGLLEHLDRRLGVGRYAVVLASDHGATRSVERSHSGRRVEAAQLRRVAERAAAVSIGTGAWIASVKPPYVQLSEAASGLSEESRERLLQAVLQAVRRVEGIGYAELTRGLAGPCDSLAAARAVLCRAVVPGLSGEILYGPAPGSMVTDAPEQITTHGSPHPEDATVPIIVLAPGRGPARHEAEVSALSVAPTLAKLLGAPPPAGADRPPLPSL